jgi:hypothetical protein
MMIGGAIVLSYNSAKLASLPRGSLGGMEVQATDAFVQALVGAGVAIYGALLYCFDNEMQDEVDRPEKAAKPLNQIDIKAKGE